MHFGNVVENRAFARMETELVCRVTVGDEQSDGALHDLSLGGALIACDPEMGNIGSIMKVSLTFPRAEFTGRVVRLIVDGDMPRFGVSFDGMNQDKKVGKLLSDLVAGIGTGKRNAPRLYKRIAIRCESDSPFEAQLLNISRTGFAIDTAHQLTVGDEVRLLQPTISGKVVRVSVAGKVVTAGVEFMSLSHTQEEELRIYLQSLLGIFA